ncbi:MAG: DegT/DnrJ/EryC1/StrS family aminotransferase [Gammaproteobacteria bacterium]
MFIPRYEAAYRLKDIVSALRDADSSLESVSRRFGGVATLHASASNALLAALRMMPQRGTVLVPAYTCDRVVRAVRGSGCTPIFADVAESSGTIDASALSAFRPGELTAVIATHMFGATCDLAPLRLECDRIGALLVEDCALSFDPFPAVRNERADVSIYSFGRGKPVSFGFGGLLIRSGRISSIPLAPAESGQGTRPINAFWMAIKLIKSMLTYSKWVWCLRTALEGAIKACFGTKAMPRVDIAPLDHTQLPTVFRRILTDLLVSFDFDREFTHRRQIFAIYHDQILERPGIRKIAIKHFLVAPVYPLFASSPNQLHKYLIRRGIDTARFFSYSIGSVYTGRRFENSERLANQVILLPNHRGVSPGDAKRIARHVNRWCATAEA